MYTCTCCVSGYLPCAFKRDGEGSLALRTVGGDGISRQYVALPAPDWRRITRICCPSDSDTVTGNRCHRPDAVGHITSLPVTLREAHPVTGSHPDGVQGVQCDAFKPPNSRGEINPLLPSASSGLSAPSSLLIPATGDTHYPLWQGILGYSPVWRDDASSPSRIFAVFRTGTMTCSFPSSPAFSRAS